jgi:hypothetical protein
VEIEELRNARAQRIHVAVMVLSMSKDLTAACGVDARESCRVGNMKPKSLLVSGHIQASTIFTILHGYCYQ